MLRVGVIGAGWFASRRHLPELVKHPRVELVALCRRSAGPLAELAEHFGVVRTYTDHRAMLAEAALDAVLICSPHNLHADQTRDALAAGCHVLLEKPMALTAADARDLAARAAAAGKVLEVAYNPPYWRHCAWLREQVASGAFGELEGVDIRSSGNILALFGAQPLPDKLPGVVKPTTFRGDAEAAGGGYLTDGGSHGVAEVLWVTQQRFTSVSCTTDELPNDKRYCLSFTLAGGGSGQVAGIADSARTGKLSLALYQGSRASALVRATPAFEVLWLPADGEPSVIKEADLPDVPQPVVSFVDAILGGSEPRCPGAVAVDFVAALEAAYESAASGRRVVL